ncbi:response regulator [Lysinibacillus sp. SGAir0095]|uniref:response regulator n=1 Tax=Lysinibacillus sp. SGAir0095 TaxID=2070463 RepID=UPI0010CD28BC|nr:response regulator [Lysinibacillus sp. SGAir0095]QCR31405.1 two-component system response regulator [Lysinibacillus sp. SGAir0095]
MKKILIVDDQKGIRLLLNEVFSREGYKVYQASNGVEALKIIENEEINCVMLDMKIPGMNGIEILSRIREKNLEMPVCMMTAFEGEDILTEANQLGITKYFRKPFNILDVRDEVNALLND